MLLILLAVGSEKVIEVSSSGLVYSIDHDYAEPDKHLAKEMKSDIALETLKMQQMALNKLSMKENHSSSQFDDHEEAVEGVDYILALCLSRVK